MPMNSDGAVIGVGNQNPKIAKQALEEGTIDVAAFGRPLISNPDFMQRLKKGEELVEYEVRTHLAQFI
jgi:N-ethylmaleimide reductase